MENSSYGLSEKSLCDKVTGTNVIHYKGYSRDGKDLLIPSPFYMCPFTGPPSLRGPSRGGRGPSPGHVFCRLGERGETGMTPPHAGWRRAQKILVLVTLMPHMQNGQGQNHPLLFFNFFYIVKIIEKSLFYEPEIGFIGKKTSKWRIIYFLNFLTLKTF